MSRSAKMPHNVGELLAALGGIAPERVRMRPAPGTATEEDLLASRKSADSGLCELVDGALVEKALGIKESLLATAISRLMGNYVDEHDLGAVFGADGLLRLDPGLVRIPDVSFVPWKSIPDEEVGGDGAIGQYVPDLAVEVISPSNTPAEIRRKLRDYFFAGARLVWIIQPKTQTAQVYTSPGDFKRVPKGGILTGAPVLPGFQLPLAELFSKTRSRRKGGQG